MSVELRGLLHGVAAAPSDRDVLDEIESRVARRRRSRRGATAVAAVVCAAVLVPMVWPSSGQNITPVVRGEATPSAAERLGVSIFDERQTHEDREAAEQLVVAQDLEPATVHVVASIEGLEVVVGVAENGEQPCMYLVDQAGVSVGGCVAQDRFLTSGSMAVVAHDAPGTRTGVVTAVLVQDGFDTAHLPDGEAPIASNVTVFALDDPPGELRLSGPAGETDVAVPDVPWEGAARVR
jgi:hypothetical protein